MSIYQGVGHYKVYVASFGYEAIIRLILRECGLEHYITDIFTGKTIGQQEGFGLEDKNPMLALLMKEDRMRTNKILLIDDSPGNIEAAHRAGYHTYQISDTTAMTVEDAINILNYLRRNRDITRIVVDADITLFRYHVTSKWVYDFLQSKKLETLDNERNARKLLSAIKKQIPHYNPRECPLIAKGAIFLLSSLATLSNRKRSFTLQQLPRYQQQIHQFLQSRSSPPPPPPSPSIISVLSVPSYMRPTIASSSRKSRK